MHEAGFSNWHVTGVLGVSQSTVARMQERFQTHGNVRHRHGGGRERIKTQREDRFIVVLARRQRLVAATTKQNGLQNATDVRILMQTITYRLHRAGMRARRPAVRIPLTRNRIQACVQWARAHVRRALNDWTGVLFINDSRFCVLL